MNRILLLLLFLSGAGLAQDDLWDDDDWGDEESSNRWNGFVEGAFGRRLSDDPVINSDTTLEELRWRVESKWQAAKFTFSLKMDGGFDGVESDWFIDVRDLTLASELGDSTDIKFGRQVQTWGTGDLVFLNDLFPKDFVSFFAGRDDEYLKAPGNVLRITHYSSAVNVDFAWTPVFEPDIYLTGERFSFFSPFAGENIAPEPPLSALEPEKSLGNGEFALRLFRNIDGREVAGYAYSGYFKQPTALTPEQQPTFAAMNALGASLRQPLGSGLLSTEISYYDSSDDRDGTDPLLPNDQLRWLLGFEWEAKANFTVGLQYYLEWTLDHDSLLANSPFPQYEPDEHRHLLTNRLTYRAGRDKYVWSLFTFYSPSDHDAYVRPVFTYRHSDTWSLTAGANLFGGKDRHTFFKQLSDASNAYLRVKYNY